MQASSENPSGSAARKRVLFINDTSRNGGPGRTLFTILKFLDPARIERTVFVPREGVVTDLLRSGQVFEDLFCDAGLVENLVEPHNRAIERADFDAPWYTQSARAGINVVRATRFVLALAARVKRERYDAIFCNGTSACFLGGGLARLTDTDTYWHVFYPEVAPAIRRLHQSLAAHPRIKRIACVSKPLTAQFDHVKHKVSVLHDAIDIEEFDSGETQGVLRKELGLAPDVVVFGSQGRIVPHKGYVEFIRAAAAMIRGLTPEDVAKARFVVLGDTPDDAKEDHLASCRALVSQLGLTQSVHFLGFRKDVRPYVTDFDVAVVPSIYEDPLPRAVMEAMAMRKPVIAFGVGGIPEMVRDGDNGLLVSGRPPDVAGLARAMLHYFRDPAARLLAGVRGRERIKGEFEAKLHAKHIEDELVTFGRSL